MIKLSLISMVKYQKKHLKYKDKYLSFEEKQIINWFDIS